ncbi:hypothetical protein [Streptomyces sanglieri]|uniref:hypothetical protein n=1 Tax=Streptomyces sanglieri TaxID=193460 RepID=UPI003526A077
MLEQENEVLRRAAAYLSQATCRQNDVPARPRAGRPQRPCAGAGDVPGAASPITGGWPAQSPVIGLAEAYRANALFDAHRDDPEFGHRFLVDEARAAGEAMAE